MHKKLLAVLLQEQIKITDKLLQETATFMLNLNCMLNFCKLFCFNVMHFDLNQDIP